MGLHLLLAATLEPQRAGQTLRASNQPTLCSQERRQHHLTAHVGPQAHRLDEDIPQAKDMRKCLEVYVLDVNWLSG